MKCELCHNKEAETAIQIVKDGREEELYVCNDCANGERIKRQKKSQRTRKTDGPGQGVSMPVPRIGGPGENKPPPIIEALMDAFSGIVTDMASTGKRGSQSGEPAKKKKAYLTANSSAVGTAVKFGDALHLEGLFLIGELESARRALDALELQLEGFAADGISDAGHIYRVKYSGGQNGPRALRVFASLAEQEVNARVRLFTETPRVLGDAMCRALAVLKNCRLLSPGELFDLLSPLRIAAVENMLDGMTLKQMDKLLMSVDLSPRGENVPTEERDRLDAERADEMNKRFEDVVLNERAEERFL